MSKLLADPKRCTKCGVFKPRTEFYPHSVAPRGVSSWCKECTCKTTLEKQKAEPSKANAASRKSKLKRKFGLTQEQYDRMLADQNGGCAICGTERPGGMGRFPVDHCHATGAIRGLLCNLCNVGLGAFQDDLALMEKAMAYVKNQGGQRG